MSKMKKTRKPGGGRKQLKPEYDAGKNLKEQMESAVAFYDSEMSLQAIGDELGLNPIKVRNLMRLGNEISKSIKHKDTSYVINLLAYIFVDPEIHQSVENVLGSSAKKAIVVWFINYFI